MDAFLHSAAKLTNFFHPNKFCNPNLHKLALNSCRDVGHALIPLSCIPLSAVRFAFNCLHMGNLNIFS